MPELPEVETLRRSLEPRLVGRRIVRATLHRRDVLVLPGDPEGGFSRARAGARPVRFRARDLLAGARVTGLVRRGKQLGVVGRVDPGDQPALCVHLGMSGRLLWAPAGARPALVDHVHASWRLDDGSRLVFRDPRRFGGLWAFASVGELERARWGRLGPDALGVTARALAGALAGSRRAIKGALLDQGVVAGVGNIYADEALFAAAIDPRREAGSLDPDQTQALARQLRRVLRRAVRARGSTLRDYVDAEGRAGAFQLSHAVYGRAGQACRSCGGVLESGLVAQRTTVWCPACQS